MEGLAMIHFYKFKKILKGIVKLKTLKDITKATCVKNEPLANTACRQTKKKNGCIDTINNFMHANIAGAID